MNIPARFQADCAFCGEVIDIRKDGVHQRTSGWVKRRSGGGGNAIALPERLNEYACPFCIDSEKHKHGSVQFALFT